ncbi:MAG: FAD-dependent monooxygenase [Solirubrobacteraceae bacterium]
MTRRCAPSERTEVCVVGAGPAGLLLANVLAARGVGCIVLERQTRAQALSRARAGLTASSAVAILERHGLAEGLLARGVPHDSIEFRSAGQGSVLNYAELGECGPHYVYPQQELVADLVRAFEERGGDLRFGVGAQAVTDDGMPLVDCTGRLSIRSELVAGCDGSHSIVARAIPPHRRGVRRSSHAAAWLAVLAQAPPSTERIIYATHARGFAGHMLRTPEISRYYLEIAVEDTTEDWPDDRVWRELRTRLAKPDWTLTDGPIIAKDRVALDSIICEPMQHGRIYLAGDSAHLLTPAAARGMNLAVADGDALAEGMVAFLREHDAALLDGYTERRMPDVLEAQSFSDLLLDVVEEAGPGRGLVGFAPRLAAALGLVSVASHDTRRFARRYGGEHPAAELAMPR